MTLPVCNERLENLSRGIGAAQSLRDPEQSVSRGQRSPRTLCARIAAKGHGRHSQEVLGPARGGPASCLARFSAREHLLGQPPRVEHANRVAARTIKAAGQADRTRREWLLARLQVALLLHPPERDVDGAALQAAAGSLDQLEPKQFSMALEQLQDEPFG